MTITNNFIYILFPAQLSHLNGLIASTCVAKNVVFLQVFEKASR